MFSAEISRELKFQRGWTCVAFKQTFGNQYFNTYTWPKGGISVFSAFKLVVLFYAWLNCFLCFTPIITNYRAK